MDKEKVKIKWKKNKLSDTTLDKSLDITLDKSNVKIKWKKDKPLDTHLDKPLKKIIKKLNKEPVSENELDDDNIPIKKKRPDRKKKLLDRKDKSETVVKSSLLKYIQGDDKIKSKVVNAIKDRVDVYSKRLNLASIALSGIIKELFDNDPEIQELPDILDQTFIRQLILGTLDSKIPNQIIESYYERNPRFLELDKRHSADRNIYSSGAIKYITNIKNSLAVPFTLRIKKFTKEFAKLNNIPDTERIAMFYDIQGFNIPSSIGCVYPSRYIVNSVVDEHRNILGYNKITDLWLKNEINVSRIIRYYVKLNNFKKLNNYPMFNIVPICRIGSHFMTIDSHVLYGIMKDLKMIKCNSETFINMNKEHWESFLKINLLHGKNNNFTGTIETDGISLCTHFMRPKNHTSNKKPIKIKSTDRVLGLDPGRENIYYAAEKLEDGTFKSFALTRNHYYQQSGTFRVRQKTETWTESIKDSMIELSKVSTKGINLKDHLLYLDIYFKNYNILWNEYTKSRWARQRLSLYGGKKRVFERYFNSIKNFDKSKKIIIAYGSAKFASGGKGEVSVPTTSAYKECSLRFPIIVVDEFRTTRVHHEDESILGYIKREDKNEVLRGLLWCSSTNNSKFVNRDLNAAINIRRCVTDKIRPLSLQRLPNQPSLDKRVVKKIKC